MEDSVVSQTALAARALALYPIEGAKADLAEQLRRAQHWLLVVKPGSMEERDMRLLAKMFQNMFNLRAV